MIKIAIIGTAGRKTDGVKLNRTIYQAIIEDVRHRLEIVREPIHLVSGGAAYMDHLAVLAYLRKFPNVESLELFFPCKWQDEMFQRNGTQRKSTASVSNNYHEKFSLKMKGEKDTSLKQIQRALDNGARYHERKGFYDRNLDVGYVDYILAYTFGKSLYQPKDGGTFHTWSKLKALTKIHIPIALIGENNG
jgi:hypothetical protein